MMQEPELAPVPIDPKQYQQLIADIGELLYEYFYQLDKQSKSALAESTATRNSCSNARDKLAA